jgi:hypothetical protein
MIDQTSPKDNKILYNETAQIENLVRGFEERTLPFSQWTHEAHITVAVWYLYYFPLDVATEKIRNGIQTYNLANGIVQTPTRGYHETITLFFIWSITEFLQNQAERQPILETTNALLADSHSSRLYPFEFYSRERLLAWEARTHSMTPDLKPFE